MADEVESVVVTSDLIGEFIEEDAFFCEFFEDGLLAFGVVPDGEEVVQRGVFLEDGLA